MKTVNQVLIAILLFLLITVLGLHLYENYTHRSIGSSSANNGIINQTLNYGSYARAAKFASVLSTLNLLKQQVELTYSQRGIWPDSLADIGLAGDALRDEQLIDDILIQEGTVYANIESEFVSGATVRLVPKESLGGLTIQWVCETNIELKQVDYCSFVSDIEYPKTRNN